MKVYTKRGDKGKTSLASGRRVDKFNALIEAYGTVDELNAAVGELMALTQSEGIRDQLSQIQYLLFNIGSMLARDGVINDDYPDIKESSVSLLEDWMDRYTESLKPMTAFILPSGSHAIAKSHVCRTVCRRAERRVLSVQGEVYSHDTIIMYLNRLSDYFFVLARYFAQLEGVDELLWKAD